MTSSAHAPSATARMTSTVVRRFGLIVGGTSTEQTN